MLRSDRLLDLQRVVNLIDVNPAVSVYKFEDFQTEGMGESSNNFTRQLQFFVIERNFSPVHKSSFLSISKALVETNMH